MDNSHNYSRSLQCSSSFWHLRVQREAYTMVSLSFHQRVSLQAVRSATIVLHTSHFEYKLVNRHVKCMVIRLAMHACFPIARHWGQDGRSRKDETEQHSQQMGQPCLGTINNWYAQTSGDDGALVFAKWTLRMTHVIEVHQHPDPL